VPVKLRIENLKVVVVRDAGRRHLIELRGGKVELRVALS
jgi:hypothetical protein